MPSASTDPDLLILGGKRAFGVSAPLSDSAGNGPEGVCVGVGKLLPKAKSTSFPPRPKIDRARAADSAVGVWTWSSW